MELTKITYYCIAFAAVGVAVLFIFHGTHAFSYAPYALLLLCPLMHVFMMRGHGHAHHKDNSVKGGDNYDR